MQKEIEGILQSQNTGARVCKKDTHSFTVYDCPEWGLTLENKLLDRFPELVITVESSNKSLSGFILILTRNNTQHEVIWTMVAGLLLAMQYYIYKDCLYHTISLFK